ncbi:MAG: ABC transporter permease [Ignavibacteriae bacterium]|nr:ABC transporter permease [Ignavibacteria bacterium]MBI3363675.1 ABC transporter permease [Ignavibacteriota bacterium]
MQTLTKLGYNIAGPVLALIISFAIGGIFIAIIGKDPLAVYSQFFSDTLGNAYGIGQVLFKATPLIFTGLASAICFRAGLFNIGAEGQLIIGAFCIAFVGNVFGILPAIFLLPLCILAGFIGGACWGIIPGLLKATFGAHEVINTIMMNFIAAALVNYFVSNVFFVPATVHTPDIVPAAHLSRLDFFFESFHGAPVNLSLFIAIGAALLLHVYLWKTSLGYELRATGLNLNAARYAGIHVERHMIGTLTLGGGLAGLAGMNFVMGYKHYFELGFSEGAGFIGIAVALLARNNPIGIVLTSIFFGILQYGSLTINTIVPKELANILQAIVILCIIVLSKVIDRHMVRLQKQSVAAEVHA